MYRLQNLNISDHPVSDISALSALTKLRWVFLVSNDIVDLQPLVDNPGFGEGDILNVGGNPLSSESINVLIPALEARGVTVTYW